MWIHGPGPSEYRFFWWREVARFGSVGSARAAVKRHGEDPQIMLRFRALLWDGNEDHRKDEAVAEDIAKLLAEGRLITEWKPFYPYWL